MYKKSSLLISITFFVLISFIILLLINDKQGTNVSNIHSSLVFNRQENQLNNISKNVQLFKNFVCDDRNIDRFLPSTSTPSNNSFDVYRKNALTKYCNMVPLPKSNWISAKAYTENDIVFVIFTAASFFHTRATATRDTWLSRITNYYYLSATPYPYLPVTVIPNAGENKLSNMKKLFYGLQIIYEQQIDLPVSKRQKWFYIAGCDTFIIPHHLLKRLDGLDYTQAILLGGHSGRHPCLGNINPPITVEFPSGGAGFFFSFKLLEIMQPHLTNFVENVWPKTSEISDVALTCLAAQLGVRLTRREGFWSHPPDFTLREHGREQFHKDPEPNDFHYVQPDEMYALDEFYINQHMDRLINDKNWNELIPFTRRFVASHYELLRKKRRECTLPKI